MCCKSSFSWLKFCITLGCLGKQLLFDCSLSSRDKMFCVRSVPGVESFVFRPLVSHQGRVHTNTDTQALPVLPVVLSQSNLNITLHFYRPVWYKYEHMERLWCCWPKLVMLPLLWVKHFYCDGELSGVCQQGVLKESHSCKLTHMIFTQGGVTVLIISLLCLLCCG